MFEIFRFLTAVAIPPSGSFLGVIGILMQLRKVCNHPDLFMERVIESPFDFAEIEYPVHSRFLLPSRKSLQSPTANLSQFILKVRIHDVLRFS